jgi:hypothetical protein
MPAYVRVAPPAGGGGSQGGSPTAAPRRPARPGGSSGGMSAGPIELTPGATLAGSDKCTRPSIRRAARKRVPPLELAAPLTSCRDPAVHLGVTPLARLCGASSSLQTAVLGRGVAGQAYPTSLAGDAPQSRSRDFQWRSPPLDIAAAQALLCYRRRVSNSARKGHANRGPGRPPRPQSTAEATRVPQNGHGTLQAAPHGEKSAIALTPGVRGVLRKRYGYGPTHQCLVRHGHSWRPRTTGPTSCAASCRPRRPVGGSLFISNSGHKFPAALLSQSGRPCLTHQRCYTVARRHRNTSRCNTTAYGQSIKDAVLWWNFGPRGNGRRRREMCSVSAVVIFK